MTKPFVAVPPADGDMGLDRRLLHLVHVIGLFKDMIRLRETLFNVANLGLNVMHDIALGIVNVFGIRFVVNHRRAWFYSFVLVKNGRQHLILNFNQLERLLGNLQGIGGDSGNSIADDSAPYCQN